MERMLILLDPNRSNLVLLDFTRYIVQLKKAELVGIYLKPSETETIELVPGKVSNTVPVMDIFNQNFAERQKAIDQNIDLFAETCEQHSIQFSLFDQAGVDEECLIKETRFADLLITNAYVSRLTKPETVPTQLIREIIQKAECPVLVAPENFDGIDELVFAYDGSRSAVFAIKQFTYLFPALSSKKAKILLATKELEWPEKDKKHLKNWLKDHYPMLEFELLYGYADTALMGYFLGHATSIIVLGAYGRSSLSQFFKPSSANLLLKTATQPIFIAHH